MATTSTFTRTLGSAAGSFIQICQITASDATAIGVNLNVAESASGTLAFKVRIESNATGAGLWQRLVPVGKSEQSTTWAVEMESNHNVATFRFVRTAVSASTTSLSIKIVVLPSPGKTASVVSTETSGSGATSAGTFESALLTQVDGRVGIGTAAPEFNLDVVGNVNVTGAYRVANANVLSATALGPAVTSSNLATTGVLASLSVSGNVNFPNLTQNTASGNVLYVHTGTGRLHFGTLNTTFGSANLTNVTVTGDLTQTTGTATLANLVVTAGSTTLQNNFKVQNSTELVTGNTLYIDAATGNVSRGLGLRNSSTLESWVSRTSAADNGWYGVTYGNGLYVAVGVSGTGNRVMTSPDGITWTARTTAPEADIPWVSVTWGNGLFVAVSWTGVSRVMTSPDGINWTIRTSVGADPYWNSVVYANNIFVAVCYAGETRQVMTSPNGITWTLRTTPLPEQQWYGVTYGNGLFVAVAQSGTGNRVMTSPDGITWTSRTSAADNAWQSVTFGNGLFVAVATSGTGNRVMTSPDGITWTIRQSAADNWWHSVTWGNGLFVAVATFESTLMTSSNGINWTSRQNATNNQWRSVAYGDGRFVAVADTGTGNRVMTWKYPRSYDVTDLAVSGNVFLPNVTQNTTFTQYVAVDATTGLLTRRQITGNTLLITHNNFVQYSNVSTTTASNTYATVLTQSAVPAGRFLIQTRATMASSNALAKMFSAIHINGNLRAETERTLQNETNAPSSVCSSLIETFAASTEITLRQRREYTFDPAPFLATAWTSRTSAADNDWRSVTYGNGLFVAVSGLGVMTSSDGITWTSRTSATIGMTSVAWGNNLFVAVTDFGTGNRVMTSPDGITWTARTSAADNDWRSVTWGNGLFVAVAWTGTGNRVMTSSDGITWTSRTSAADLAWFGVTWGNGLFVAVAVDGTGNRVMTSPDGITWTSRTSAADNEWAGVVWGNGLFVAVSVTGTGNRVMTSPDGITWTTRTSAADNEWRGVTWGNGLFVAVARTGTGNRVMTSPDGITWTIRTSAADNGWHGVAYGNGRFVAVAFTGTGNRVMTWDYPDGSMSTQSASLNVLRLQ